METTTRRTEGRPPWQGSNRVLPTSVGMQQFALWYRGLMPKRGFPIDSNRPVSTSVVRSPDRLALLVRSVRGERVILNGDLAARYGVPTKALNLACVATAKPLWTEALYD